MNKLQNILKSQQKNVQKMQNKSAARADVVAICCIAVSVCMFWVYMQLPYGKVHTIDDENYVYTLMNRSVPISLDLSDDLWWAVKIESIEEILEYYEMLYKLPVTTEAGKKSGSPRRTVSGVIHFLESPSIYFTADSYIVRDGIMYGNEFTEHQVSSMTDRICDHFYTTDNLGELIGSYNRVVLRRQSERSNLTIKEKSRLKEIVMQGKKLEGSKDFSEMARSKGEAVCQIEIYSSDIQKDIPQIYIVVFENGFCQVYDVDNTVGSIMFFAADTPAFLADFAQNPQ